MGPERQKSSKSVRSNSRTRSDADGGASHSPATSTDREQIAMQTLHDPDEPPRANGSSIAARRSARSGHVAIPMPSEGVSAASSRPANAGPAEDPTLADPNTDGNDEDNGTRVP